MVEFAILLPVFAMLVFGAFSGAEAYNQKLTLVAAAREASRYGATLPIDATSTAADDCNLPKTRTTWLNCVEQSAVQTATGQLSPTVAGRQICVAYVYNPSGQPTQTQSATYTTSDTPSSTSTTACNASTAPGTNEPQVQVTVQNSGQLQAILFTQTLTLGGSSVSRYERA